MTSRTSRADQAQKGQDLCTLGVRVTAEAATFRRIARLEF